MEILKHSLKIDSFFQALRHANERVLMLDYDGVLAPFQINRMEALPYPEVESILERLTDQKKTRVVMITGRQVRDLLLLFKLASKVEVWGSHGLENLTVNGDYKILPVGQFLMEGLTKTQHLLRQHNLIKLCEIKPRSIALHWRGLGEKEMTIVSRTIGELLTPIVKNYSLQLCPFDGGIELCASNIGKGDAVEKVLAEVPKDAIVAYLGDDFTDEKAFKILKEKGLAVLVRPTFRDTSADIWLKPPKELVDFLYKWSNCENLSS
ncbi:MAG: hypothetical protein FD167_670 [bacterium]|nr:MAG: hypothetical protein FD167_670 [bacterium]